MTLETFQKLGSRENIIEYLDQIGYFVEQKMNL
jgi:hypothetical protein